MTTTKTTKNNAKLAGVNPAVATVTKVTPEVNTSGKTDDKAKTLYKAEGTFENKDRVDILRTVATVYGLDSAEFKTAWRFINIGTDALNDGDRKAIIAILKGIANKAGDNDGLATPTNYGARAIARRLSITALCVEKGIFPAEVRKEKGTSRKAAREASAKRSATLAADLL